MLFRCSGSLQCHLWAGDDTNCYGQCPVWGERDKTSWLYLSECQKSPKLFSQWRCWCPLPAMWVLLCIHHVYFNGCMVKMHYVFPAAAPRRIRIIAQSSTTLNISWAAPVGAQRYILGYNISCLGSGISWSNQTADNMTFSTIVTGLHPYTRYFCCVSAITSTAEGARACMSPRTPESGR